MKTDELIDLLARDTTPAWRLGPAYRLALGCGVLIAAAIFFVGIGFRPDIASAIHSPRFLFKFVVTTTLAVGAGGLTLAMSCPGEGPGAWRWVLLAAPLLLAAAVAVELMVMPESTWAGRMIGENYMFCMTLIPLMSVGPLACLILALRQGAPSHPGLAGALAGIAAGAIAATFYAANCDDDSPLYVALWYPLAIGMVTAVGYFAGRRLLRW